ncbi:Imm15 family immunity protein [Nitrospirillum viridazoti]|uniref:Imm15 family immunity protein n=1 Tax=Nitrospirillum viridazoti TaxID=3144925 RepID=UPI0011A0E733|nr:Imm15 family immunity protein [Nitrospirillum amazonense]
MIIDINDSLKNMMESERLFDFERLIRRRSLGEVPLYSRYKKLSFLSHLPVKQKSEFLTLHATRHLDSIIKHISLAGIDNCLVMVSLQDFDFINNDEADPIYPSFWICTDVEGELLNFRLKQGKGPYASTVGQYLSENGLANGRSVLEWAGSSIEDDVFRVYIARNDCRLLNGIILE